MTDCGFDVPLSLTTGRTIFLASGDVAVPSRSRQWVLRDQNGVAGASGQAGHPRDVLS